MAIEGIQSVVVNGTELGLGGYLDIGLHDTMGDLWVNFLGALTFSVIGYHCLKSEEKKTFLSGFIIRKEGEKEDGE